MRTKLYIGMDVAETLGMAFLSWTENAAQVFEIKGTPIKQMQELVKLTLPLVKLDFELVYVFEEPHHMRNYKVVCSLQQRYGYLKHSLLAFGHTVREINVRTARAWIGENNKQGVLMHYAPHFMGSHFTDNHADALLVAEYQAWKDGVIYPSIGLKIVQGQIEHES